jgi:uncharacterized protein (DUF885 family)
VSSPLPAPGPARRRVATICLGLAVTLGSGAGAAEGAQEDRLDALIADYVRGEREGDALAPATEAACLARIAAQQAMLTDLREIDEAGLSPDASIDRRLLTGILEADIYSAERRRPWQIEPRGYLPAGRLGQALAAWEFGEMDETALVALLDQIPPRLVAARQNLQRPPRRFTEAALYQARETRGALAQALAQADADADGELGAGLKATLSALDTYLEFLAAELLPRSTGSWAIGDAHYNYILAHRWHMDADADAILRRGREAFADTEALAQAVSERIAPGRHWSEVYDELTLSHPQADGLKAAYQESIDAARRFVLEHHIVTLPPGERVITLDTPPAMRRSSPFGTFDGVDPFGDGLTGRLLLTPVEAGLDAQARERRLRAHHFAWIPIIAVHEAYPGHHVDALKTRENPRPLRRVVHEPIFSEGWGLFTEELMFEMGFLQGDAVRLTQLRNRLWRAARVILDVSLHTGRMSFDEAVAFLVEHVRFDPHAAALEVGMYIRRPTYVLGYLIGMQEIMAIRDQYRAAFGEPSPPSVFYDRLLRAGPMPPALVREAFFPASQPTPDDAPP